MATVDLIQAARPASFTAPRPASPSAARAIPIRRLSRYVSWSILSGSRPPPGGIVSDPFAGSGTTLLAARNLGFDSISFEKEPEYYRIALSRQGG